MIFSAVFTVSLTSLCYEVLLTRFFSYSQWNHLSFMVISIVLFGFGASGSVLSLLESRRRGWSESLLGTGRFLLLILLCSLSIGGSFVLIKNIPLDYFRLPLDWRQAGLLLATFLVLLVPFFFSGAVISLAFAGLPAQSGWVYFSTMLGSAVGALLPAALLPSLGEGRIVILCALILAAFSLVGAGSKAAGAAWRRRLPALAVFAALGFLFLYRGGAVLEIHPSPYKYLPQVLQFPDTRVSSSSITLRGRLDRLESPYIRFVPGLSLKYSGGIPGATYLFQDGDELFVLYDLEDPQRLDFCRFTHSYAGYLGEGGATPSEVLIVQKGGGLSLPCAAAAGARNITLLFDHPKAAESYRGRYAASTINVWAGNPRAYLARNPRRYDRIHLEAWGPSIPGMASLNQEHLLTVEAFDRYLDSLTADGVFIVSRKLLLPPSDCLKTFAAAYTALERRDVSEPAGHIVVLRGWDSYTILLCPTPFAEAAIAGIKSFCEQRNFDLVFYSGIEESEANRFNSFDEPFHFREIRMLHRALKEGKEAQYFRRHYLDIAPGSDDRPFHSRFTRWLKIGELYRVTGSRLYFLLLSGETVVLAVLVIALALSVLLLILPGCLSPRRPAAESRLAVPASDPPGRRAAVLLYFLSSGAGFMFLEMTFLQRYTFLLGNPIVAFTVVLAELLILSGVGGALSARWPLRVLVPVLAAVTGCMLLLFLFFRPAGAMLLGASPPLQAVGLFLLLAPASLLVGIPFPMGLRLLVSDSRFRAFGWAANGIASVVAAIVAVPLSMTLGITKLLLIAALCYALMLAVLMRVSALQRRPR